MIILIRELARNRNAFLIWTLVMVISSVFLMTFFPTVSAQSEQLDNLMSQYPEDLVKTFNFDRLSMSDPMGFYGTETYIFITLFGSIYSMLLFISLLSREESEKTAEFLLAKPVTRNFIISFKSLAALIYITMFNTIFGAANLC